MYNKGNTLTYEYVNKYIQESGDILLTKKDEYSNSKTKLRINCKFCPEYFILRFTDYQQGKRHYDCKNKNLRDEGYIEKMIPRQSSNPTKEVPCKACNKIFKQKSSKQKVCNDECRKRLIQMKRGTGHYEKIGRMGGLISAKIQVRRSINEVYFCLLCERIFSEVKNNETIFDGWDADIILPQEKIVIFYNGIWHYKQVRDNHKLAQVQARDKVKEAIIRRHGYDVYIIKDMGGKNKKFVESEFLKFLENYNIPFDESKFEDLERNWNEALNYNKENDEESDYEENENGDFEDEENENGEDEENENGEDEENKNGEAVDENKLGVLEIPDENFNNLLEISILNLDNAKNMFDIAKTNLENAILQFENIKKICSGLNSKNKNLLNKYSNMNFSSIPILNSKIEIPTILKSSEIKLPTIPIIPKSSEIKLPTIPIILKSPEIKLPDIPKVTLPIIPNTEIKPEIKPEIKLEIKLPSLPKVNLPFISNPHLKPEIKIPSLPKVNLSEISNSQLKAEIKSEVNKIRKKKQVYLTDDLGIRYLKGGERTLELPILPIIPKKRKRRKFEFFRFSDFLKNKFNTR